ncbi:hypothetical protein M2137_002645, partial [Parabacteroides sp. PFB2-10]|nr:hypothetical protein [Parabacteroides sp. PFB2-10]
TSSSPLTQKISVTNYISNVSKNDCEFLVDTNDTFFLKRHPLMDAFFLLKSNFGF